MTPRLFSVAALLVVLGGTIGVAGQGTPAQPPPAQPPPAAPAPGATAPTTPQQPPVTFRAEVNYVEVDARVLDAQGRFVTELTQKDFQVFEDGKPQQVTAFSLVNIPLARPERPLFAAKPIEPDVQTNLGFDGRVYLIVLDDLHTHPLRTALVKAGARRFVERYVGANDIAAVVHVSGRGDAGQEFTSNQRLLLSAIDKFMGRKLRSSVLERIDEEQRTRETRQQGERINDPRDAERGFEARNALDTLKSLAEYLGNVRGRRKAMVLFSEGIDYDINDPFGNRDATTIMDATRDAIATATRGNVAIYGIDPRGLTSVGTDVEIGSFPDDPTLNLGVSALNNELRLGQDSLRVLADETGGFASVNTNDADGAFQRLIDDNSSYYVLGYYPANDRRDGRFRRIEVRVTRPGLTVRARKGYVAPRGRAPETKLSGPNDASPELREAMTSPLPMSTLPMAASAAVFKGPAPNGSVVVSTLIGARDLELTEKNGTFQNDLEIALMAVSQSGKTFSGDRNTVNLLLKPDTVPRVRAGGFRVITSIDLPAGRYQLRVAAREANGKRAGSIFYDVDVPDFSKEKLAMSGIALTSASSGIAPTVRPKDPLKDLLPGPLTTYRDFVTDDELAFFAEVYDNTGPPAHKVALSASVKAEGGQTVFQTREERDSSELAGQSGGYGFTARVPLKEMAPGLYVLRIDAQVQAGDRPSTSREVMFRVVARPTRQGVDR
jgi:VWFA-related protein